MAVKTPMMPRSTSIRLPAGLSLRESVNQLTKESPKDANAKRIIQQLIRETASVHHFLVIRPEGMTQVDPDNITLDDIAVPREVRTERGIDVVRIAAIEIQQYARVGV
ncbi:MAG: hypothetical protein KDA96_12335 [Planctomycetaceae bacterium]|nr:hypothetical protein [Planctomycetaceae bacterium]